MSRSKGFSVSLAARALYQSSLFQAAAAKPRYYPRGVEVLRELLTVPLIAAVAAAFVFATVRLFRNRPSINTCNVAAALILLALNGLIWGL